MLFLLAAYICWTVSCVAVFRCGSKLMLQSFEVVAVTVAFEPMVSAAMTALVAVAGWFPWDAGCGSSE